MLPSVDFCGLKLTRLVLGANPFGGYSHQNEERDREMLAYHTIARIRETWQRAEAAGINAMVTNNEWSPSLNRARREGAPPRTSAAKARCRTTSGLRPAPPVNSIGAFGPSLWVG